MWLKLQRFLEKLCKIRSSFGLDFETKYFGSKSKSSNSSTEAEVEVVSVLQLSGGLENLKAFDGIDFLPLCAGWERQY